MKTPMSKIEQCELTDYYEAAIMHKTALHMRWEDSGLEREVRVNPYDLQADHGKEYLLARTMDGDELRICLDQVVSVREFDIEH